MPYNNHTLKLTIKELTAFAKSSPKSDSGFVEALNVVKNLQKQGKTPVILWPSRKPVQVYDKDTVEHNTAVDADLQ